MIGRTIVHSYIITDSEKNGKYKMNKQINKQTQHSHISVQVVTVTFRKFLHFILEISVTTMLSLKLPFLFLKQICDLVL